MDMGREQIPSLLISKALTFDDILLVPAKSDVLPTQTKLTTRLSRRIDLKIPLVSAAMDTVTESQTAIVMAQEGGIGIIHKNLKIRDQVLEVQKVKKYESGMILDPVTISPDSSVRAALELMQTYKISGVPVTEGDDLVGILTNRDLRFIDDSSLRVCDLMTAAESGRLVTAPEGTTLEEAKSILQKHRIEKLPVVDSSGKLVGLITIKDIEKSIAFPDSNKDRYGRLRVGAACGVGKDGIDRAIALAEVGVDVLVVDTAHGHSQKVIDTVKEIKKRVSEEVDIIAGNIVTKEAAEDLIRAGADGLKVGVGPGSICTTRIIAGVGVPQITAVMNVVSVARPKGIPVIADGGIRFSGDVTKALAVGADSVMCGGLFAGTDEAPGEFVYYQGRSFKVYRGMGSLEAMREGSKDRYFQMEIRDSSKLVPEGIEGRIPYRGSLSSNIHQLLGGLRSGMGYLGAGSLSELRENAVFVEISTAGVKESHPHDVIVTKEAPNYRLS